MYCRQSFAFFSVVNALIDIETGSSGVTKRITPQSDSDWPFLRCIAGGIDPSLNLLPGSAEAAVELELRNVIWQCATDARVEML